MLWLDMNTGLVAASPILPLNSLNLTNMMDKTKFSVFLSFIKDKIGIFALR